MRMLICLYIRMYIILDAYERICVYVHSCLIIYLCEFMYIKYMYVYYVYDCIYT